jgi:hypothetical protein
MAAYTVNTYAPTDRIGLNQAIGTTSTTQLHPLGDRLYARDVSGTRLDGEFIYLAGAASTVVGSCVLIKDDYGTSLAAARDKGGLAFATAAIVASNYGWYQIKGQAVASTGTVAANTPAYLAGSGTLDDAAVAGDQVIGARFVTASDTATAIVNLTVNPATADFDNA